MLFRSSVFYFISPIFLGSDSMAAIDALSIGSLSGAPRFRDMKVRRLGDDLLVEGTLGGLFTE